MKAWLIVRCSKTGSEESLSTKASLAQVDRMMSQKADELIVQKQLADKASIRELEDLRKSGKRGRESLIEEEKVGSFNTGPELEMRERRLEDLVTRMVESTKRQLDKKANIDDVCALLDSKPSRLPCILAHSL